MKSNQYAEATSDCQTIEALIPDYAFGLTTLAETRLVESNLVRCPEVDYKRACSGWFPMPGGGGKRYARAVVILSARACHGTPTPTGAAP